MGFGDGSGISWTICKQSALRSSEITVPTPHHPILTGRMLFLMPNQRRQSTEGAEQEFEIRTSPADDNPSPSVIASDARVRSRDQTDSRDWSATSDACCG